MQTSGGLVSAIRLHHFPSSSSSWRVRIVLALKGVFHESVIVDLAAGAHLEDEHRARNPLGQVPCLEIEGRTVTQSVAICELLEELHPEPHLLPSSSLERARVRALVEVVNAGIQPLHNSGMNQSLRDELSADDVAIRTWKQRWLARRLAELESLVERSASRFCIGDALSLADVFLYPQLDKARGYGVDPAGFPVLAEIERRLRDWPEFPGTGPGTLAGSRS
jgi:maleylpyruvate isomerase